MTEGFSVFQGNTKGGRGETFFFLRGSASHSYNVVIRD